MLFSGDKSEESWNEYVRRWGHGDERRFSVSGVGDRAYGFYPKPRDKYEGVYVVVVARVGLHTIGVAVEAEEGQAAESVQPQAIALARVVAAELRTASLAAPIIQVWSLNPAVTQLEPWSEPSSR